MIGTLYGKLALSLTLLVAALLSAQIVVTMRVGQAAGDEATQALYRDVARRLLQQEVDPSWGLPVLESEFASLMQLNPLIELYWLDREGRLLAYSAPEGRVVRQRVDVAPIRAFLEGGMLPLYGDDPRDATRRVIFSAAESDGPGRPSGFLYVVLGGESYQSLLERMGRSRSARLAAGSLALLSLFGLVVGLVLFRSITRRVGELDRAMARFLADAGTGAPPELVRGADELERLRATFDHLAARVRGQVGALEEVDRLRRELVASASHDLRTPLAALRGYLETLLMLDDSLEPAEQRRYLEAASRHTDRLSSLVDGLFELAKLESGGVQPRLEPFQLEELAQDVLQPYELRAQGAGVELRSDLATGLPPVNADIGLIERVLVNLIENALRHTPSGGHVALVVRAVDGDVELSIRDTGRGIPPEALPLIFERFYRVGGEANGDGMGLGLAIVARILELHGREIRVASDPGRGSTFSFRLG